MIPVLRATKVALSAAALVAAALIGVAPAAQASSQVYNPCDRLSAGQVKFSAYGANRVTFVTATDRSSDVVTITGCVRSGAGYAQEWQDWGYVGLNGFAAGSTWENTFQSPSGSYSVTEALGRSNPGTSLYYHTINYWSRWGGERGATYNQYFEGAGGPSDENLWDNMNLGYYEQAAVINYNREPDMPTVQGASFAIFFHAGRVPSAGCVSTALSTVTRFLQTNQPGDRIIMGAVDDVFTPYSSNPFGAINQKYGSVGGNFGMLGATASNETSGLVNGGAYQLYQNGAINWSPASGAHVSMGAIRGDWARNGFEGGPLGYPVSDEVGGLRNGGVYQMYQNGAIVWAPGIGAFATRGAIRSAYAASGFENGPLGYATSDEAGGLKDGGSYQMFQNGAIVWSPSTGAHVSMGAIRGLWGSTGFENGPLGYPTSNEYSVPGGVAQNYQGGVVTWAPGIGARAALGAIGSDFQSNTGLGAAVTGQIGGLVNGGTYQMFENGGINWSPATGAHVSTGAIRSLWASTGFEGGPLGYPTSDEIAVPGGVYQTYQGGAAYWSPSTGAHAVIGALGAKVTTGGGFSALGFPTGEQVNGLVSGGAYQTFQRGILIWSAATGAHVTSGAIRTAWGTTGFEHGPLGYPTSDPYAGASGSTVQDFQNGQITLAADGTVSVAQTAPAPAPTATATPVPTTSATAPAPAPTATASPTATAAPTSTATAKSTATP